MQGVTITGDRIGNKYHRFGTTFCRPGSTHHRLLSIRTAAAVSRNLRRRGALNRVAIDERLGRLISSGCRIWRACYDFPGVPESAEAAWAMPLQWSAHRRWA